MNRLAHNSWRIATRVVFRSKTLGFAILIASVAAWDQLSTQIDLLGLLKLVFPEAKAGSIALIVTFIFALLRVFTKVSIWEKVSKAVDDPEATESGEPEAETTE